MSRQSTRRGSSRWTRSHTAWGCKYHVVFILECLRKKLYEQLRRYLGEVFLKLAERKQCRKIGRHLNPDPVHMLIVITPKNTVSNVVGYIKGKSAIQLAQVYSERMLNFAGQHFLARILRFNGKSGRGCNWQFHPAQEQEDRRLDLLRLLSSFATIRWPKRFGVALATLLNGFKRLTNVYLALRTSCRSRLSLERFRPPLLDGRTTPRRPGHIRKWFV